MPRRVGALLLIVLAAVFSAVPLFVVASRGSTDPFLLLVAGLNCVAWLLVIAFTWLRMRMAQATSEDALNLGIDPRLSSFETVFLAILHEVRRKNDALSLNIVEQKILSKRELSRALENIVGLAYRLLQADSAELALFDEDTGLYHSALVLGKPFRVSAQAMLSDAAQGEKANISPDVLVQPVSFAGTVLGTLRVSLKLGKLPSLGDREIMNLLALQAGLALMNAQYSDQLMKMRHSNEESVRAKTGFLANLSHEIRGPLGIMLNAVELVLDGLCGDISDDQRETLRMVKSNGEHLLELINDVLDYAKVESGRINPKKSPMAVDQLLKDLASVIRSQAEAKSHKIIHRPNDEALAVSLDRRHARQMLINLLTNAVKYTPNGGKIEIWAERVPGNKVKINVKDSGVGIEEHDRHKVFAAFERIENSYSMNQVGTGLGMPLTKRLAEVNGGAIDFSSVPGEGTQFWLIFPAVEGNSAILGDLEQQEAAEVDGKGNHVLLVEKDLGEQKMIARYLKHIGFRVAAAASKIEALEILRGNDIELAIVGNDVADNPEEDLVGMIRDNARTPTLPVVLVSSRAFTFDIERYLKAGVDRCLTKPIELKELAQICRKLIDGTYTGEVLDQEIVQQAKKKSKADKNAQSSTKVYNAGDIRH